MLTIHEIGTYSVTLMDIEPAEEMGLIVMGEWACPECGCCLTDVQLEILDPMDIEPAEEMGLIVMGEWACPECGCCLMDVQL